MTDDPFLALIDPAAEHDKRLGTVSEVREKLIRFHMDEAGLSEEEAAEFTDAILLALGVEGDTGRRLNGFPDRTWPVEGEERG